MIAFSFRGKVVDCSTGGQHGYKMVVRNGYFGDVYHVHTGIKSVYITAMNAMSSGQVVDVLVSLNKRTGGGMGVYVLVAEDMTVENKSVDIQL